MRPPNTQINDIRTLCVYCEASLVRDKVRYSTKTLVQDIIFPNISRKLKWSRTCKEKLSRMLILITYFNNLEISEVVAS